LRVLDDIGDSESFTRPGHPEQGLKRLAGLHASTQLLDGLRLVARRSKWFNQLKFITHNMFAITREKVYYLDNKQID
jgi:hypothetical protein